MRLSLDDAPALGARWIVVRVAGTDKDGSGEPTAVRVTDVDSELVRTD